MMLYLVLKKSLIIVCVLILTEALSQLSVDFHHVWFRELWAGGLTLEVQGPQWRLTPHHRHQGQQTSLTCKHMEWYIWLFLWLPVLTFRYFLDHFRSVAKKYKNTLPTLLWLTFRLCSWVLCFLWVNRPANCFAASSADYKVNNKVMFQVKLFYRNPVLGLNFSITALCRRLVDWYKISSSKYPKSHI